MFVETFVNGFDHQRLEINPSKKLLLFPNIPLSATAELSEKDQTKYYLGNFYCMVSILIISMKTFLHR